MEDLFSEGKTVRIETADGDTVELYMRFLKVKELAEFYRIVAIEDDVEKLASYIAMIKGTVEVDELIDDLPFEAVFDAFEDLNFPVGANDDSPEQGTNDNTPLQNFTAEFDFMVSQGHAFDVIMEYPVPRYLYLLKAAMHRVFGKKDKPKVMDTLDAFRKLGIPVKNKQ